MTTSSKRAAKTLCEISGWSLTNLQIQKILYLANRAYLGRYNTPLIEEDFEAWDYGPVLPDIYRECNVFGNKPVWSAFFGVKPYENDEKRALLEEAYEKLKNKTGGQLVSMTHRDDGAWEKVYEPGAVGIKIPRSLIEEEYEQIHTAAE